VLANIWGPVDTVRYLLTLHLAAWKHGSYCDHPFLLWWCCSVAKSKWLEDAVAQLSLQPTAAATEFLQQQQQQQAQQGLDLGVLKAFDLSLLRYQDRDALVETFQRYRQKVS
jgi:hypothetical protein